MFCGVFEKIDQGFSHVNEQNNYQNIESVVEKEKLFCRIGFPVAQIWHWKLKNTCGCNKPYQFNF